ncbi:axial regulator YABBY 4-like [Chenopodium quinoa]|uniref:axial regulator YABBY 4-like n=1 Tax=Chenopodium quinoa TaxID=63459 RepID=UPI000B7741F9|nr:axial regulator YABBY 4-like [Chenopodium quinoa]
MATLNRLFDTQEQICYVQCSFCTTILLVSVPYSSMTMVVTVRCGHCTGLLSVSMLKASFVPLHLFSALNQDQVNFKHQEEVDTSKAHMDRHSTTLSMLPSSEEDNDDEEEDEEEDEDNIALEQIVNKPPEKKRRAPSAYNKFIKEEIRRLKARNPNMTHKEAFSTAAKNWAHFPSVQHEVDEDNDSYENSMTQNLDDEDEAN